MVTGGGAMHLNDAFGREPALQVVCTHHEQAAAMAAESYFRRSGRLAALNVTTGPGCLNALNGVFGAYVDSLGMVVISGQVKRETIARNYPLVLRQLGDQEVDIVTMVRPIVKYAALVNEPGRVKEIMDKALFLAGSGRPGPVWIDVPGDIQGAMVDPSALKGFDPLVDMQDLKNDPDVLPNTLGDLGPKRGEALDDAVEQIVERLSSAKRPVILAGAGIRISGMHREFIQLVEALGVPVVCGWNAYDVLTNDHPCYAGRPGSIGDRAGNFTVQNADALLVLGSRLNIRQVSYNYKSFARFAWKAMVDIDPAELSKPTLDIDLPVHADLRDFIPAMLRRLEGYEPKQPHGEYLVWCRERVQKYPVVLPEYWKSNLINPYCFVDRLFRHLRSDDVVISGDGTACVTSLQASPLQMGQRLYTNSGCASMGYDLPAAIGAYFASDGGRVICIAGDGSIMMNLQELQTIVGLNLPVKIFVLNNQGYHSIRQTQQAYFPDNEVGVGPESGLTFPDFVRLAAGFGIPAYRFDNIETLDSELDRVLGTNGPVLCEIMLDLAQGFAPKLASRKLADGTMVSSALEDLAPFLPREELAQNMIADDFRAER
jgi:acetolactate synthase-1/2/3 large subunit